MAQMPEQLLQAGQRLQGFEVRRVTPLENLRAMAYELVHVKTGARLLHLHAADTENLFAVIFATPCADDTGVPHILEHAVLGGSKRFPVKDPFFEMVKSSMATFINAMTARDHTMYPVASNVRQDFYNLAEVYWDAVFHPNLTEMTFKREGHHLEFADNEKREGGLLVKGIVYNEMKGVYSSPSAIVGRQSFRGLFPDSPYGRDSGGDPLRIPELTYEQFVAFHRRYYHPSSGLIFLYGDIPTSDHLAFLGPKLESFDRRDGALAIPRQPRWDRPRRQTEPYAVGAEDSTDRKTFITMNWLLGDSGGAVEELALEILELVLLGNQAAPLHKAIIDSKLGEDLTGSGVSTGMLQDSFHVGIKGSEADRTDAFEKLVLEELGRIAESGITSSRVEAAFQQLAYQYQEVTSQFPLSLMRRTTSKWLYGQDPLLMLRADQHLKDLKQRWQEDPQLFARIIRAQLIENPHRLTITFVPDRTLTAQREAEFRKQMAELETSLSAEQRRKIAEEARELKRLQDTPNTREALALLPQLKVRDLPPRPKHIPTTIERLASGIELLRNDVLANGVNYFHIDIDLAGLGEELFAYLPLYADCVRKMGTESMNYVRLAERVAAHTGGIGFSAFTSTHSQDPSRFMRRARLTLKFLDGKADEALDVMGDLLLSLDPRDTARLKDVVLQSRAYHRTSVAERGQQIALSQAARGLGPDAYLSNLLGGVPQTQLVLRVADQFDASQEHLVARLLELRELLKNRRRLTASFTGSETAADRVKRRLEEWSSRLSDRPIADVLPMTLPPGGRREGLAAPMQVAYCAQVLPAPHLSHPDSAALMVGSRLVSMDYILEEVRFKGTAYGGGCTYSGLGRSWSFHSYRDPWITRTLNVYAGALDYVRRAQWSQSDVDRAIIGTAKEGERPIRPAEATSTALSRYILGDTPELRERRHAAVLGVTAEQARRAVLELLESAMPRSSVCVVSSRPRLEAASAETPGKELAVEDILK